MPAVFDDVVEANRRYAAGYWDPRLPGTAARGLAVLTCIDSRIDPLSILGLGPGDAKIIRNAGARVTDDALRSLVLAVNLLHVDRVCIVQHTDCAVAHTTEAEIRARIEARLGVDASAWEFGTTTDQVATLREDMVRVRACPLLPPELELGGFIYDVATGVMDLVTMQ
ncbi:MAG: carbonic anhydrase [Acidimicrobiia bacterium]|nr:carbonic anhydrase [Acidimicrobiia bacterium]